MKLKKNWIKVTEDNEVKEEVVEEKEEKEMNFFQKHKKGLIIGGISALVATAAGVFLANKSSDDEDEEDVDFDEIDDEEIKSELESE